MEKKITQEMFDMLTSTMWQDYKGYKREQNLKTNIKEFFHFLLFAVIGIFAAGACFFEGDIFILFGAIPVSLSIGCIWGIIKFCVIPWSCMSKVNKVAFDIELSSTEAKIIRTKKMKYGIVCDYDTYLRLILPPKYDTIKRTDYDCFIISSKNTISKRIFYGIYNSNLRRITVPVRFDKIFRPNDSANLYIVEKDGETYKFNSMGDRIVR